MANSGQITKEITTNLYIRFSWEIKSQSPALNNSNVSWKAELVAGDYARINSTAPKAFTCVINGVSFTGTNTIGINPNTTKTLAYGSLPIMHNIDGSKTFSFRYSQELEIIYSGKSYYTIITQGTGELDIINRASTITALDGTIGKGLVINIKSYDSNFKHTLKYSFGSASGTIGSGYYTKGTWFSDVNLHNQLTSTQNSKDCVLTCETYRADGVLVGTTNTTVKMQADAAECAPSVSATIQDTKTQTTLLTGNNQTFIRYQSNGAYNITHTLKYGATVKSYEIKHSGSTWTTKSGTIPTINSDKVEITVVDSRGFKTTITKTLNLIEYVNLTCDLAATAPTASGNAHLTISGHYFNNSFTSAESNVLIVVYRYKINDGSWGEWNSSTTTIAYDGNTYKQEIDIGGLDYEQAFTFQARAADKILTIESREQRVKTVPLFDWGENDFTFNVPVYVREGAGNYNIGKIGKVLTTTYNLPTTITKGANYTKAEGSAVLIGNNLRCYMSLSGRSAASGTGDIANEVVCSFSIRHDGKIAGAYAIAFSTGSIGSVASFVVANAANDGTYLTFDVSLTAAATGLTNVSTYFTLPCSLNLENY